MDWSESSQSCAASVKASCGVWVDVVVSALRVNVSVLRARPAEWTSWAMLWIYQSCCCTEGRIVVYLVNVAQLLDALCFREWYECCCWSCVCRCICHGLIFAIIRHCASTTRCTIKITMENKARVRYLRCGVRAMMLNRSRYKKAALRESTVA